MIKILEHAGSDNSIANTARISMEAAKEWNDLPPDYTPEARKKLITYLAKHQHTSPFRHTSITIHMHIPIFLARQLGKHQAGLSWNEESRRYRTGEPEFFYPDGWREVPDGSIKQGSAGVSNKSDVYMDIYDEHIKYCLYMYNDMLKDGIAPEMARMVLPQSMMTEVIWTGNLMAFAHVYRLRVDSHAQLEAQDFAKELDSIIRPLYPEAWGALVGE